MSTWPAVAVLKASGDYLAAALEGEAQVLFALSGDFAGCTFALERLKTGETSWGNLSATRIDNGENVAGTTGSISAAGYGIGFVYRADAVGLAQARVRVSTYGSGTAVVTVWALAAPVTSPFQEVTGDVRVSGGEVGAVLRVTTNPAQSLPVPGSTALAGQGGETADLPGDRYDGARVHDPEVRRLLAHLVEGQERLFLMLLSCFKRPELSEDEVLSAFLDEEENETCWAR